jgi:hypothetical protein
MKTVHIVFVLFLILLSSSYQSAKAQKIFSEGIIRYDVFVNNSTNPEGVYMVTVKNGFTKRELAMNTGYNNIAIHNSKTGITTSLNANEETRYALEMTAQEVKDKNKRFEKATFTEKELKKKIASYQCTGTEVKYLDGETATLYYCPELLPPNESFNIMFPGLPGIPLEYQVRSTNTMTIRFVANRVETKSIDLKVFNIPDNYKIVTTAELEKMK